MHDSSEVSEARRTAAKFAGGIGFDEHIVGQVMLVVTEMATNLLKHGGGGDILMAEFADLDGTGIELLALDQGPGMADVAGCLADGYSSAGSPGTGLGAIGRQSDRFAVYSRPGKGTVVKARFVKAPRIAARAQIGVAGKAYGSETVSGDNWTFGDGGQGQTLFMVDGSGHGREAARAANAAVEAFDANLDKDCVALAQAVHRALAPTRGGAIAIGRIDGKQRIVRFVGIGNIGAALVTGTQTRRMVSQNGVAGHIAPTVREFTYPFASEQPLLIFHSDGVSSRWDLANYPGIAAADPSLLAGILFRDFRRATDDALVVTMRPAL